MAIPWKEDRYVFLRSSALEAACARLNSPTFEAMIAYRRPVCEPEFRRPNKYHAVLDSGHRVLEIRRLMDGERVGRPHPPMGSEAVYDERWVYWLRSAASRRPGRTLVLG